MWGKFNKMPSNKMPVNIAQLSTQENPEDKRIPFFCIHPITGIGDQVYLPLAKHLYNRDFYAISSPLLSGLQKNGSFIPKTIDELAKEYISFIKSVQPHGPYCLGGWSFGGLVAFRMAFLLEQEHKAAGKQGECVAFLGLFDTVISNMGALDNIQLAKSIDSVLTNILDGHPAIKSYVTRLSVEKLQQYPSAEKMIEMAFQEIKLTVPMKSDIDIRLFTAQAQQLTTILEISKYHLLAAANFKPNPEDKVNQITLFEAIENNGEEAALLNDWSNYSIKKIQIQKIQANHMTIIQKRELARSLRDHLDQIDNSLNNTKTADQMIDLLITFVDHPEIIQLVTQKLLTLQHEMAQAGKVHEAIQQIAKELNSAKKVSDSPNIFININRQPLSLCSKVVDRQTWMKDYLSDEEEPMEQEEQEKEEQRKKSAFRH